MFKLTKETAYNPVAVAIASQVDLGSTIFSVKWEDGIEDTIRELAGKQGLTVHAIGYFGNNPNTYYQFGLAN